MKSIHLRDAVPMASPDNVSVGDRDVVVLVPRILRAKQAAPLTGKCKASFYADIADGLMVPPVRLRRRSTGFPDFELAAINRARIGGATDDELRALVLRLVLARKFVA